MPISRAAFLLTLAVSGGSVLAQPPSTAPAPRTQPLPLSGSAQPRPATTTPGLGTAPGTAAPAPLTPPSLLLKPSLAAVQGTLNELRIERWKKGSVRDEAFDNVSSLLKDLQTNLPPLMVAADAAPASLSQSIPLVKHLDAFYDVLLRVEEAARVSAPADQISSLQQTMLKLNQSRLALDDRLQSEATVQEKQVVDLQTSLKTQQQALAQAKEAVAAIPPPQPCKPPAPAKKKPAAKKPAPSTTPPPTTPAKPSAGQSQPQGHTSP